VPQYSTGVLTGHNSQGNFPIFSRHPIAPSSEKGSKCCDAQQERFISPEEKLTAKQYMVAPQFAGDLKS
jgi:hypothetical protein